MRGVGYLGVDQHDRHDWNNWDDRHNWHEWHERDDEHVDVLFDNGYDRHLVEYVHDRLDRNDGYDRHHSNDRNHSNYRYDRDNRNVLELDDRYDLQLDDRNGVNNGYDRHLVEHIHDRLDGNDRYDRHHSNDRNHGNHRYDRNHGNDWYDRDNRHDRVDRDIVEHDELERHDRNVRHGQHEHVRDSDNGYFEQHEHDGYDHEWHQHLGHDHDRDDNGWNVWHHWNDYDRHEHRRRGQHAGRYPRQQPEQRQRSRTRQHPKRTPEHRDRHRREGAGPRHLPRSGCCSGEARSPAYLANWHRSCDCAGCSPAQSLLNMKTIRAEDKRARVTRVRRLRDDPRRSPRFWDSWFGEIDLAPVGLFRIAYGVLFFNWIWQLWPDLGAFFTDEGILPRASSLSLASDRFSILMAFGASWQVALFWAASLVVAVMVIVGYRSRLACALAFIATISFQERNPLILDGSDLVYRMLPFWLTFASPGARYSLDAALQRARGESVSGTGWAFPVRLLQLQVAWIYLATGLEKMLGTKWPGGTATYYAMQLKHTFGRGYADFLVRNDIIVRAMTWGTLAVELGFLPAVFFPAFQPYLTLLAVAGAAMLHMGIALFMNVGNFPVIMLAALILFLPPRWIHRIVAAGRRVFGRERPLALYYDGTCTLCRRTVGLLTELDLYKTVLPIDFRRTEPPASISARALERRMHLVDERGRVFNGFGALVRTARGIPLLAPLGLLGSLPGVAAVGERGYDWIAGRRPMAMSCPEGACGPDTAEPEYRVARIRRDSRSARPVLAGLTALAIVSLSTAVPPSYTTVASSLPTVAVARFASLDQKWDMFSPDPAQSDGWLRGPGVLEDGTLVDVIDMAGRPAPHNMRVAKDENDYPERTYDPLYSRWAKVTERIAMAAMQDYRLEYARSICRFRNLHLAPGEAALDHFDLYYTERVIGPPGTSDQIIDHHLWTHIC